MGENYNDDVEVVEETVEVEVTMSGCGANALTFGSDCWGPLPTVSEKQ